LGQKAGQFQQVGRPLLVLETQKTVVVQGVLGGIPTVAAVLAVKTE
jgi:hypothetical protein